jgi:carboxymethylenebutenolidase
VLLLHERYGPVDHSFNVLNRFAEYGFVAAMPDFFYRYEGDRGPIERAEDRIDLTDDQVVADLDATIRYLHTLAYVAPGPVGVAGFCLSGRVPIVYAVARPEDVAAIAVAHGGIYPRDYNADKPGQASVAGLIPDIGCPVLGMFGENDRSVPMENIARFRRELERNGIDYWVRVFAGAPHAWMNTTNEHSYREPQSEESWSILSRFFGDVFDGVWDGDRNTWLFQPDAAIDYDFAC